MKDHSIPSIPERPVVGADETLAQLSNKSKKENILHIGITGKIDTDLLNEARAIRLKESVNEETGTTTVGEYTFTKFLGEGDADE